MCLFTFHFVKIIASKSHIPLITAWQHIQCSSDLPTSNCHRVRNCNIYPLFKRFNSIVGCHCQCTALCKWYHCHSPVAVAVGIVSMTMKSDDTFCFVKQILKLQKSISIRLHTWCREWMCLQYFSSFFRPRAVSCESTNLNCCASKYPNSLFGTKNKWIYVERHAMRHHSIKCFGKLLEEWDEG